MFHFPALVPFFQSSFQVQDDGPAQFAFAQIPRLFPFFKWVDNTWICNYIKGTTWIFPLVETIHILSLVVLVGAVLLVDFRLLGIGLSRWTPKQMARQLGPFMKYGLIVILITGTLLFIAEPRKLYDNAAFGPKMILLASSIVFQYTIFRKMENIDKLSAPIWGRLGALLSLTLWFGVGVMGRAIGFV
jgi:hypothetical protein